MCKVDHKQKVHDISAQILSSRTDWKRCCLCELDKTEKPLTFYWNTGKWSVGLVYVVTARKERHHLNTRQLSDVLLSAEASLTVAAAVARPCLSSFLHR